MIRRPTSLCATPSADVWLAQGVTARAQSRLNGPARRAQNSTGFEYLSFEFRTGFESDPKIAQNRPPLPLYLRNACSDLGAGFATVQVTPNVVQNTSARPIQNPRSTVSRPFRDEWGQKRPKNGPYQTSADETDAEFLLSGVSFTPGSRQVVWQGLHGALCAAVS